MSTLQPDGIFEAGYLSTGGNPSPVAHRNGGRLVVCTTYTLRVKFQDNQGVVQSRNGSNETAQLRKDLRSIGYFKVGYQKMVNMAESSKTFKMYHYKQVKCEAKTEDWPTFDQYMKVTGRYGNEKSRKIQDSERQMELGREPDPYPWLAEDDTRRHQTDEEIL